MKLPKRLGVDISRRGLLGLLGLTSAVASTVLEDEDPLDGSRLKSALHLRTQRAQAHSKRPLASMAANGDEEAVANRAACFTKGLPQNEFGEVDPRAYDALLKALKSGNHQDFERLPKGGGRKLNDPEAAFAFHLEGGDPHTFQIPLPPALDSPELALEASELYWQAICRDIPFRVYDKNPVIHEAAEALRCPIATVFRGTTPGDHRGPYISQFLLKPIPFASGRVEQRYRSPEPGSDFMTTVSEWSQIQLGIPPWREAVYQKTPRYIISGRDLAEYVHYDYSFQAYVNAALILFDNGPHTILNCNPFRSFVNPYRKSRVQDGFVTFGQAEVVDWLGRVSTAALKAAYCQKWLVHRRLRPEALGGLVHFTKSGVRKYPIHDALSNSNAVASIYQHSKSYLLPQAYPEGCPLHPSYPAGHAAIAGACCTVLKACFEETLPFPSAVAPTPDGFDLVELSGFTPTIGDEVNKLAYNVAIGRDWAGIHYRSDSVAGLRLGEEVAITILQDLACTYSEDFSGFAFTTFAGKKLHISNKGEVTRA